jgi:hypothetical protein
MPMTDDVTAALFESPFGKLTDELLERGRDAAKLCLDAYEQALDTIAGSQEQLASQTDVEWLATAVRTQAKLVREIGTRQVTLARELLD